MTTLHHFEDRLLQELRQVVAERPAPAAGSRRRPRRTRVALAGIGIAAAAVAVAMITDNGAVTPSAYAVESRADGAVTVSIRSLSDAAGLERRLRAAGVPAVVDYVPASQAGCAAGGAQAGGFTTHTEDGTDPGPSLSTAPGPDPGAGMSGPAPGTHSVMGQVRVGSDGATFTIDPGTLKPGEKVFITTSTGAVSSIGMAIGTVKPDAPCLPSGATP